MKARDLVRDLNRQGVQLEADGDGLIVDGPKNVVTTVLLARLTERKRELLRVLENALARPAMRWARSHTHKCKCGRMLKCALPHTSEAPIRCALCNLDDIEQRLSTVRTVQRGK